MMVHVIKSERGKDIVVDDQQFMYHHNGSNKSKTVIYWECANRRERACLARLHTKSKAEDYEYIKYVHQHNHLSSKKAVDAKEAVAKLKERATVSSQSSRSMVSLCMSSLDNHTRSKLGNVEHISRKVRQWRHHFILSPASPTQLTDSDSQSLHSGDFPHSDSEDVAESGMLVFGRIDGIDKNDEDCRASNSSKRTEVAGTSSSDRLLESRSAITSSNRQKPPPKKSKRKTGSDDYDLFEGILASKLQKMDSEQRRLAEIIINEAIAKGSLGSLTITSQVL